MTPPVLCNYSGNPVLPPAISHHPLGPDTRGPPPKPHVRVEGSCLHRDEVRLVVCGEPSGLNPNYRPVTRRKVEGEHLYILVTQERRRPQFLDGGGVTSDPLFVSRVFVKPRVRPGTHHPNKDEKGTNNHINFVTPVFSSTPRITDS